MEKICLKCEKSFIPIYTNAKFCSRNCIDQYRNDLKPRKTLKSYRKANIAKQQHINKELIEVIMGTLLGDACLILQTDNFHRLSLCHSDKQKEYIDFKRNLLNSIFLQQLCNKYIRKDGKVQWHCHSISHSDLTNLYGLFYRNKKKFITRKLLNLLTPSSLLFWYLDDGSMIKASGNSIVFCTDSFSLSEVKAIKIWLWQKHRIESFILPVKGSFGDRQYFRLRLRQTETIKFLDLISTSKYYNLIPQCMIYKFVRNK